MIIISSPPRETLCALVYIIKQNGVTKIYYRIAYLQPLYACARVWVKSFRTIVRIYTFYVGTTRVS